MDTNKNKPRRFRAVVIVLVIAAILAGGGWWLAHRTTVPQQGGFREHAGQKPGLHVAARQALSDWRRTHPVRFLDCFLT